MKLASRANFDFRISNFQFLFFYADVLAGEVVDSKGTPAETCSTGRPAASQASNPPNNGHTSWYPLSFRIRAILALVASFGQVQYITTGRLGGISVLRRGNSSGGIRRAPGIFVPAAS